MKVPLTSYKKNLNPFRIEVAAIAVFRIILLCINYGTNFKEGYIHIILENRVSLTQNNFYLLHFS